MTAHDDAPSTREIAELTGRLRRLSVAGSDADAAERAAFLADKDALLARIPDSGVEPGRVLHPHVLPPIPTEILDGIEQRRTGPAERDDPAEFEARLADLRARATEAAGRPADGWETVGAAQAARELAARGTDFDTARQMVTDYLRETSERFGVPAQEWGLDQGDVDAVATAHGLPAALAEQDDTATERAAQLARSHTDDATYPAESGATDDAGWSR